MAKRRAEQSMESPAKRNRLEPSPSLAAAPYSMRKTGSSALSPLTSMAIKAFTKHLLEQTTGDKLIRSQEYLKALPEHLLLRVWSHLSEAWPGRMTHAFIIGIFLRGSTVILPGTLPGVTKNTIKEVVRLANSLKHLEVTGHKIPDKVFKATLEQLPSLEYLSLRDCSLVGPLSCKAISLNAENLKYLNLGGTAATFAEVRPILSRARELEVLKLAGLEGLTDINVVRLLEDFYPTEVHDPSLPLAKLRSLKLRHTPITGPVLAQLLRRFPLLEKLDVSFVPISTIPLETNFPAPPLTKLSLTSTPVDAKRLIPVLEQLTKLKTLNIGALGASAKTAKGFTIGGSASGAMGSRTLNDATLFALTEVLRSFRDLESLSLAGNSSLGQGSERAMPYFIGQVGRKLKYLNVGGLPYLRSDDLHALLPSEGDNDPSRLERLVLLGTNIDDGAAVYISACPFLIFLDLENTKVSGERNTVRALVMLIKPAEDGLFDIIDACPLLEKLNLTSCRRVKVTDRRRFFDVWREKQVQEGSDEGMPVRRGKPLWNGMTSVDSSHG